MGRDGGRHCSVVAFALPTQLARVRFSAFLKFLGIVVMIDSSALLRESGQCMKGLIVEQTLSVLVRAVHQKLIGRGHSNIFDPSFELDRVKAPPIDLSFF